MGGDVVGTRGFNDCFGFTIGDGGMAAQKPGGMGGISNAFGQPSGIPQPQSGGISDEAIRGQIAGQALVNRAKILADKEPGPDEPGGHFYDDGAPYNEGESKYDGGYKSNKYDK
jgi:hypothetical protein